eukprot:4117353-Pyramimonas_sp.AAC.1
MACGARPADMSSEPASKRGEGNGRRSGRREEEDCDQAIQCNRPRSGYQAPDVACKCCQSVVTPWVRDRLEPHGLVPDQEAVARREPPEAAMATAPVHPTTTQRRRMTNDERRTTNGDDNGQRTANTRTRTNDDGAIRYDTVYDTTRRDDDDDERRQTIDRHDLRSRCDDRLSDDQPGHQPGSRTRTQDPGLPGPRIQGYNQTNDRQSAKYVTYAYWASGTEHSGRARSAPRVTTSAQSR